jgi:hypothetical protein
MVASVTFQPYLQSGGNAGLFNVQSSGYRQGTAMPDPSTRYRLRGGILATTETLPMWGGVGVYANVPGGGYPGTQGVPGSPSGSLGPILGRATALTGTTKLAGFSVFDEAYGMITSPQSPVPLAGSGMQVNYYPLGSLARIVVACDPSLTSLRGGTTYQPAVAWDFTNQLLIPELGTLVISSGTYVSATGVITLTMAVAPTFSPGDSLTLASLTGTGAFATLDGTWTVLTVVGSVVTLQGPVAAGAATITGGNATVGGSASQALPVNVLDINPSNSETVVYNSTTGFATYNYSGAAALIQI